MCAKREKIPHLQITIRWVFSNGTVAAKMVPENRRGASQNGSTAAYPESVEDGRQILVNFKAAN